MSAPTNTGADARTGTGTHDSLTAAYLSAVGEARLGRAEMDALTADSTRDTIFEGRCLSRPVFLGRDECDALFADLEHLHAAVTSLPETVFGGDVGAFAQALGLAPIQEQALVRGRMPRPSRLCRADLYLEGDRFQLMELNMGSALGGLENASVTRAMLTDPVIAGFAEKHRLSFIDTLAEVGATIRSECGVADGERPFVAVADWPPSFAKTEGMLKRSAAALAAFGLEAQACSIADLHYDDGGVRLGPRRVDIVYRIFLIEDLLDPDGPRLIEPVLRAAERDQVRIFAPLDSDVFGSKAALALLCDEQHRDCWSGERRAALDRLLPWTRMVRAERVTVDGQLVDLVEYALAHRTELILKPTLLHGGAGVLPGWTTDASDWARAVHEALDRPFVLQRRLHPAPEWFPTADGESEPWTLTWGAFLVSAGAGGLWMRGSQDPDGGVVNMATGATATCCLVG